MEQSILTTTAKGGLFGSNDLHNFTTKLFEKSSKNIKNAFLGMSKLKRMTNLKYPMSKLRNF